MTTLTLLAKVYQSNQLKQIDKTVKNLFEGLSVETKILGDAPSGWVQMELTGEDEAIAKNLLAREIGFCPTSLEQVKKFSTLKGYVANLEKSREELLVDIGVFQPKTVHATVPLSHLQAQLAQRRKTALKKIAELWGICENLPVTVKVVNASPEEDRLNAEFSTGQIKKLGEWRESLLDRLIVIGASAYAVKMALEQAELTRDVIDVEALGMFEHALGCKLGTDAAGLISKLGKILRNGRFTVFNPKKIITFPKSL